MKKLTLIRIWLIAICTVLLTGCGTSLLSFRDTNPTIQDISIAPNIFRNFLWGDKSLNTFSTTASRRMVIAKQDDKDIITCAEAPPDVGEAFASAIADGLKHSIIEPKTGAKDELENNYARAVATQITPLVYRTQGLQFYRDAMHSLCVDRMNWRDEPYNKVDDKQEIPKPVTLLPLPVTVTKTTTETKVDKKTGNTTTVVKSETTTDYKASETLNLNNYNDMRAFYAIQAIEAIKSELSVMAQDQQAFFQNVKAGNANATAKSSTTDAATINNEAAAAQQK